MAYDATLASRIRALLEGHAAVTEKAMFGGVAWMHDGKMFVGITKDDLLVRVGADAHDAAVARPHVRVMDFTGRPMRGYVYVGPQALKTNAMLAEWIQMGQSFVHTLPTKARPAAKKLRKRK